MLGTLKVLGSNSALPNAQNMPPLCRLAVQMKPSPLRIHWFAESFDPRYLSRSVNALFKTTRQFVGKREKPFSSFKLCKRPSVQNLNYHFEGPLNPLFLHAAMIKTSFLVSYLVLCFVLKDIIDIFAQLRQN